MNKKRLIGTITLLIAPLGSIVSCANNNSAIKNKSTRNNKTLNSENIEKMTTLSSNKRNILVFFNDEVTGDTAYEMLKKRKDLQKNLSEFTIYKNTVSAQFTNFGVPAIVGGWDFTLKNQADGTYKDKTNEESIICAYSNSMNMLEKANYSQQWHSMQYADRNNESGSAHPDKVKTIFPNQMDLTVTYPEMVNHHYDNSYINKNWLDDSIISSVYLQHHLKSKITQRNIFKFFGNEATHTDFRSWNWKTNQPIKSTSDEATINALDYMGRVEQKIKSLGGGYQTVWDNTMIIWVSDHGSARSLNGWTNNNSDKIKNIVDINANDDNQWKNDYFPYAEGIHITRFNPTIMIKPFKNQNKNIGPIQFDDKTLLSNRDILAIIKNAIKTDDKNFDYQIADPLGTDYYSFRENPLTQSGDRIISLYPVLGSWWTPEWDKKSHRHLDSKIRVTNNIFERSNWEYSDFNKNEWKKMWK